jgi:hypothetical protein
VSVPKPPTVGDVIDLPEVQEGFAELKAGFDLERMTEPGLSTYGPPTKTGLARIKRFVKKYGRMPRKGL